MWPLRASLFGGPKETWRQRRGPRHSTLRQSLVGRGELAREPLRLLRSWWDEGDRAVVIGRVGESATRIDNGAWGRPGEGNQRCGCRPLVGVYEVSPEKRRSRSRESLVGLGTGDGARQGGRHGWLYCCQATSSRCGKGFSLLCRRLLFARAVPANHSWLVERDVTLPRRKACRRETLRQLCDGVRRREEDEVADESPRRAGGEGQRKKNSNTKSCG